MNKTFKYAVAMLMCVATAPVIAEQSGIIDTRKSSSTPIAVKADGATWVDNTLSGYIGSTKNGGSVEDVTYTITDNSTAYNAYFDIVFTGKAGALRNIEDFDAIGTGNESPFACKSANPQYDEPGDYTGLQKILNDRCTFRGLVASQNLRMKSVNISFKNIKHIGDYLFGCYAPSNYNWTMSSVTFEEGLETIGDYAFSQAYFPDGNTDMAVVRIFPSTLKTLGKCSFNAYGLPPKLVVFNGVLDLDAQLAQIKKDNYGVNGKYNADDLYSVFCTNEPIGVIAFNHPGWAEVIKNQDTRVFQGSSTFLGARFNNVFNGGYDESTTYGEGISTIGKTLSVNPGGLLAKENNTVPFTTAGALIVENDDVVLSATKTEKFGTSTKYRNYSLNKWVKVNDDGSTADYNEANKPSVKIRATDTGGLYLTTNGNLTFNLTAAAGLSAGHYRSSATVALPFYKNKSNFVNFNLEFNVYVTGKPLSLTLNGEPIVLEKTYDGNNSFSTTLNGTVGVKESDILASDIGKVSFDSSAFTSSTINATSVNANAGENIALFIGNTDIKLTGANASNYRPTVYATIKPAELTVNWSDETTFEYNGEFQAPTYTVSGFVNGESPVIYGIYNMMSYGVSTPEGDDGTSAGSHTAQVLLSETDDFTKHFNSFVRDGQNPANPNNYVGGSTKTYTITKVNGAYSTSVSAKSNLVYNGQPQAVLNGASSDGTIMCRIQNSDDDFVSIDNFKLTNAGSYTVEYYLKGDDNHNGIGSESETSTVTVTIGKLSLSGATVTLGDQLYYTGLEQTQSISSITVSGVSVPLTDVNVTNNTGTEVNNYTLTVTAKDSSNFTGSVTKAFTISKKVITPTVTLEGWTFGEAAKDPSVEGNSGNGIVTYQYKLKNNADSTYTSEKPTNAGTYVVKATIAETTGYLGESVTSEFTIAPKTVTTNPFTVTGTCTYNKTAQEPTLTGGSYVKGVDYDIVFDDSTDHTNAGSNIPFKVVFKGNYNGQFEMTFDIVKASITVTPNENQSKTYDDGDQTLSYSITSGTLYSGDSLSGALSREEGEKVGSYNITQGNLSSDNYDITFVENVKYNINAKAITTNPFTVTGTCIYDKTAQEPTLTAGSYVKGVDYDIVFDDSTDHTNAGSNIPFTVVFKGNYSGEFDMTFDIAKRPITVTPNANQSKVFGAKDPELTYVTTPGSLCDGDTLTGSLSRESGEKVGLYSITQGNLSNDNYLITFVDSVKFEITSKVLGADSITVNGSYTYNGSEIEPSFVIKDGDETLVEGVDYTYEYVNNVNAGETTPIIKVTFIGNYSGLAEKTFVIAPKDVKASGSNVVVSSLEGEKFKPGSTPTVEVKDGNKVLTLGVDFDLTYENNDKQGTATVNVVFKGNYTGTIQTQFEVVKTDDAFHYISIICFILLAVSAVLYALNKIKKLIPLIVSAASFVVGLVFMILSHECVVCVIFNILLMVSAALVACYVLFIKHDDDKEEDKSKAVKPDKNAPLKATEAE